MPMKMGIHCKPIDHSHSASLDSRVRGNDGDMFFPKKRPRSLVSLSSAQSTVLSSALQRDCHLLEDLYQIRLKTQLSFITTASQRQ